MKLWLENRRNFFWKRVLISIKQKLIFKRHSFVFRAKVSLKKLLKIEIMENKLIIFQKWYFATKIVLIYCEIVLMIEKNFWDLRLKTKNLQKFWDHYNNLFKQWMLNAFSNWSFLLSNKLEQLEFILEKNIGI